MKIYLNPNHLFFILLVCSVKGQSNNVSPKLDLDFNDTDKINGTVPIIPGTTGGRDRERVGFNDGQVGKDGNANDDTNDRSRDSNKKDGKSGPKIHGVRVTVDTADAQKSKESKESVEITETGGNKHKKRVGIHTDITFEITADGDEDANATSSAQRTDKEDASVPIFKGRGGSSNSKPRKPYDGKSYWNPNFSSERRGYDINYRRGGSDGGSNYDGYYPQYPYNVPVYTSGIQTSLGSGSTHHRRSDGWNSYTPSTYWTTEHPQYENYRPNVVTASRTSTWKPCYCITTYMDNRRRRASGHHGNDQILANSKLRPINGKLGSPFSSK